MFFCVVFPQTTFCTFKNAFKIGYKTIDITLSQINNTNIGYPVDISHQSCQLDTLLTQLIWCFGGDSSTKKVYTFDGIEYTQQSALSTNIRGRGVNLQIINGNVYLVH